MAAINSNTAHKINNSYDSEPSTGSGSSLSENNEGQISDEENMNLPYLLKPKTLSTDNATKLSLQGSQESQFRGFGDSPYGQVNKRLYGSQLQNLQLPEIEKEKEQHTTSGKHKSPGMIVFPRFYDSIMEENSCNAVDMPTTSAEAAKATTDTLSFDGKIKSLTEPPRLSTTVQESSQNAPQQQQQQQLSESFILNKMHNERSPDLFADSDEDDGDDPTDKGLGTTLEDLPEALEESQCVSEAPTTSHNASARYSLTAPTESSFVDDQTQDTQLTSSDPRTHFIENCRRERELYRRIRRCLTGVRPPPTVTTPDTDVINAVVNMKAKVINFLVCKDAEVDALPSSSSIEDSGICATSSLFKPTHSLAEAQNMSWREVLGVRQHGLSYNLNKAAEQNEYLSLSVVERYVGAETATSYVRSPSSAKKRNMRMKMLTQSPGNRLSHLAKRRAIFSSANLATNSIKLNSSMGPQILLDKKKERNKRKATPKRKTPGSKKKARKTPSSSARKRLFRTDLIKPGPSRETSKRALFQSPAKSSLSQQLFPPKPLFKPEIANRVERSKRALFSPDNGSQQSTPSNQLESLLKRKRNARDDEDAAELASQSSKLFRAGSGFGSGLTPRALKIKSQSFCIGAGSSTASQQNVAANMQQSPFANTPRLSHGLSGSSSTLACSTTPTISKLHRAHSEMSATPQSVMTDNQRKKLLWAVSQALQEKKISAKHENFRQHAADLARIVKRIFQEFYLGHTTSNSETLLRLAKKYAFSVIAGKQPDDIYLHARSHESETKLQSSSRLSGYIGPEEFAQRKLLLSQSSSQSLSQMSLARSKADGSMHNLFGSENSIDSFGFSQMSQCTATSNSATQSSLMERISEDLFCKQQQLPILPNPTLQNSSSKSNLGGLALRENVHCEQRRSAQKNFTGKDQRNISPYYNGGNSNGSGRKLQATTAAPSVESSAKAKRQISFDS
ncbi:uncharacterized protein LOC117784130 isoform X2 [Drosophila innubila]|uniref:uncharacterized protein LOC117784130 isoform X2 n=1 Tax=Drosophila innubila TaxID=198719 RepID=UPI00148C7248|nr:uncharacterized protein LOC117784130 isoform X2 [Drosophila innubila]